MIRAVRVFLKNVSLKNKLFFMVGIMALLIAVELFTLFFTINTLSATRAYVGGEGLWSKAQKDATYSLRKYGNTHDEKDYQQFLTYLKVPLGDRKARLELTKKNPDMKIVSDGFLEGRNHEKDIPKMIDLFRRFNNISYISRAISLWTSADSLVFFKLKPAGEAIHQQILAYPNIDQEKINKNLREIDELNDEVTFFEDQFSYTLGEGSRWLENLILKVLFLIALTVEFTGLFLSVSISITISRGLQEILITSNRVSEGDYNARTKIDSKDEIGQLANSFNKMVAALRKQMFQRNEVEKKLKRQKELYENLLNIQSEMGIGVTITEDQKIVYVNSAVSKIYGYTEEEIMNMPSFLSIVVEEEKERIIELLKQRSTYDSDIPKKGETRIIRKDGKIINLEYSVKNIHEGSTKQAFSILTDITERKKSEQKFRGLLESAPDAMVIMDSGRNIQLVNRQTEKLFGFQREEIIGQAVEKLIPNKYLEEQIRSAEKRPINQKDMALHSDVQLYGKNKSGKEFPVEINVSPLETSDGILVLAAIRDVSQKQEIERILRQNAEQLKASNTELEQFAYVTSHDLREPLRTVNSYVQLLKKRYSDKLDTEANEFIDYAVDAVNRMDRLINDLLSYSRINTDHKEFVAVDCAETIKIVMQNIEILIKQNNATITYDKMPIIQADELRINLLFQNLISNAVKFHRDEPPRVHISAKEQSDSWLFSVSDNGIGIDPKYAEKIFVLFQRLHSKTAYEGTGIGLTICKKIVELHGGTIWFESEVNKGSVFYFTIKKKKST